jgi:hypothetical protein
LSAVAREYFANTFVEDKEAFGGANQNRIIGINSDRQNLAFFTGIIGNDRCELIGFGRQPDEAHIIGNCVQNLIVYRNIANIVASQKFLINPRELLRVWKKVNTIGSGEPKLLILILLQHPVDICRYPR